MRQLLLCIASLAAGCTTTNPPDITIDITILEGADIDVRDRELCAFYGWVEDRYFKQEVPFIAPVDSGDRLVVAGGFLAVTGESDACTDVNCGPGNDGNTFVWYAQELHRADGSVEAGAVGHRLLTQPNWQDNPAWCEWVPAIAVITP